MRWQCSNWIQHTPQLWVTQKQLFTTKTELTCHANTFFLLKTYQRNIHIIDLKCKKWLLVFLVVWFVVSYILDGKNDSSCLLQNQSALQNTKSAFLVLLSIFNFFSQTRRTCRNVHLTFYEAALTSQMLFKTILCSYWLLFYIIVIHFKDLFISFNFFKTQRNTITV